MKDALRLVSSVCMCLSLWLGGCTLGTQLTGTRYREEAIKRGYAEYNATTGEWQWKGEEKR